MTDTERPTDQPADSWYTSELFLGSVVAILTILTAIAAFQASRISVDAGRASGRSVRTLLESNAAFLSSTQVSTADQTLYGLSLDPTLDDLQRQYFESSFSPALQEALERTGGDPGAYPFDAGYDEYQYGLANELFDEVFDLVDQAGEQRASSQRFQLATFIFAIGLAFSSWASLADGASRMRKIFAALSVATGLAGVAAYAVALTSL